MKQQNGFISISMLLIIVGLVGVGSYAIYKNNHQNIEQDITTSQPVPAQNIPVTTPSVTKPVVSASVDTKINCNNSWDCLIAAAKSCQPTIEVIGYSNVEVPFIEGLVSSGKTKYEIKKNSNSCVLVFITTEQSLGLTIAGRSNLRAQGKTDAEIDSELKIMNDSINYGIGKPIVCTGTASLIAAHLTDQKNGTTENTRSEAGTSGSQVIYTTSTGEKLTCVGQ